MTTLPKFVLFAALAASTSASLAHAQAPASGARTWPTFLPQRTDSKFGREILRILNPVQLRGRVHEEVVDELVKLGPDASAALFAFLAGTMEGPQPEVNEAPVPDTDEPVVLPEVPRDDVIVLDALKRLPPAKTVPAIAAAVLHGNVDVKLVGLRALGEIGGPRAVDAWIDGMTSIEPMHLGRAYLQAPTEEALAKLLERDSQAFETLATRAKSLEPRILPAVVRSLAASGRAKAIDVMLALLGRDAALDLVVLAQVGRLVESTLGTLPEEKLTWIRPYLTDQDWRIRREATAALGRAHDYRSFDAFLAAFDDEQHLVGQTALWTLRRISGQDFGDDAKAWREWFGAELDWFETDGVRWMQGLEDEDPGRVTEAAGELTRHALFRHEVAHALLPLLHSPQASLASAIAQLLGALGSPAAETELVRALESEHEAVRKSAWAALQQLTGKSWPLDAAAWKTVLQG